VPYPTDHERDRPWVMRTYAGHSSAATSNALYRRNLAKGQTGLSVAFDLPTQTGYDPDHELARGEVGRVGVPVSHIGDVRRLFDGIPLDGANTSMTINAPAMYLLAMYVAVADERGAPRASLAGTTQNDIVKEYLSRGTYVFPPAPSMRLIADVVAWSVAELPAWNPINICSYHLQEAGATPAQELAYALCTAVAVLDAVRDSGQVPAERFPDVVARISFFVNAGLRFVEEMCKMRALGRLWDEITRERYGVQDARKRRLRYGVQVNSLGLTEAQPENNVQRIVLEMLAVTLSRDARARAVQLPAWNEALGLPRPWDQQWALRMQQVLAHETDLLEYEDLFTGSVVVEAKVAELVAGAREEIDRVQEMGGAVAAVENGYMKGQLVASLAERRRRVESGEAVVVGVNRFDTTEPSPLQAGGAAIEVVDPAAEAAVVEALQAWRAGRDAAAVERAGGRDGRGVGGRAARGLRGVPRAHRGLRRGVRRRRRRGRRSAGEGAGGGGAVGRDAADARGQARPGRALERGRAGGGARPRRRVRGRLPGHPADTRADRRGGGAGGRARRGAVGALRLAPGGRARGGGGTAGRGGRRRAGGGRRDHPARGRAGAARAGGRRGVHAEGLPDDGDDGRDRRPGGGRAGLTGVARHRFVTAIGAGGRPPGANLRWSAPRIPIGDPVMHSMRLPRLDQRRLAALAVALPLLLASAVMLAVPASAVTCPDGGFHGPPAPSAGL
jgi:methylmalonyl-CoA mutase cobalamin-binding domain/chain